MTEPVQPAVPEPAETIPEPAPPPEPWTPERALVWNRYYDKYVVLGVLVLAFLASANRITNPSIWTQLKLGQLMAERGAPLAVDPLSATRSGTPWVDVHWLYEWGAATVYQVAYGFGQTTPNPVGGGGAANAAFDPVSASSAWSGEQIAAGTLVAMTAFIRCLTAFLILSIRRPGTGLWWTSVCAAAAVGVFFAPLGVAEVGGRFAWISLGGVAGPALVGPQSLGMLFLALELFLLHQATDRRRPGVALWLVPIFALWANVDDSFLFGLLVLAAGTLLGMRSTRGALTLGLSVAACLANPAVFRIFPAAFDAYSHAFFSTVAPVTNDQVSIFGGTASGIFGRFLTHVRVFYGVLVGLGFASFWLNRRNFSAWRFVAFLLASVLWALFYRRNGEFALVWAASLALNGQEWYQETFGTEGRIERSWNLWSVGGRAVTICAVFFAAAHAVTPWWKTAQDPQFGFGFNPDDFVFEAADYLKSAKFSGNVFNTSLAQADALNWRAYPLRKPFIDDRRNLFPAEQRREFQDIRLALSKDNVEEWKPLLDKYKISAVMIQQYGQFGSPKTYEALSHSANWAPFYDDGAVVLFGRLDAGSPAEDVAYFEAERLEPESRAYKNPRAVPPPDLPPTEKTLIDSVVSSGGPVTTQPHVQAARRWLQPSVETAGAAYLPEPARCLLAVRECRIALSKNPNDTLAYRILAEAYRYLMIQEGALLSGISLAPENLPKILQTPIPISLLINRYRQRVAALRYAILTSAKPDDRETRRELAERNIELGQLYLDMGYADEARDRFQAALDVDTRKELTSDLRVRISQQLIPLNEAIAKTQAAISDMTIDQQAGPYQRASVALGQGMIGLAIRELEEAEQSGLSQSGIKPMLLDLYCQTGRPDRAIELLGGASIDDPTLSDGPGTSAYRNGLVSLLIGNYQNAADCWGSNAILQIQSFATNQSLVAGLSNLRGELKLATASLLELPSKIGNESAWENDLGMALLEGGINPDQAAVHLTNSLTLQPNNPNRAVIAYYLEKLGKPVPPLKPDDATTPATTTPDAASPAPAPVVGTPPAVPEPKAVEAPAPK
jgi:tetratricopeptide (TPR) repeat protein